MAFLVPTLLGYIDKTKKQMIINEARDVWGASQAALTECYGLHPESFEASCKFTSSIGGRNREKSGKNIERCPWSTAERSGRYGGSGNIQPQNCPPSRE
ncbi:MAG: hypothetical protein V8S88_06785 [Lachnospiraceae bacterium]